MRAGGSLRELFSFSGFVAAVALKGVFGDLEVRTVILRRK